MMKKYLVTTAIDYTNDVIHIGHAYQKILADAYARYLRLAHGSENVRFLTGTDEYGSTSEKAAATAGVTPKEYVDLISPKDKAELDVLNISYDRFFRTTDEDHHECVTAFFKEAFDAGDIYKSSYQGLYCEGCEEYKTLTELTEDGKCKLHATREIQKVEEENYFFRWGKYQSFLKDLLDHNTLAVKPESKKSEMLAFLESGLRDIPITRPKYKVAWGIDCPIDDSQVIYVWFDALINYFTYGSQIGFWDVETEITHILGKDNAKWHVLLWPAMLKSTGYKLPDRVYVHSFLNLEGQKISKSLGNVIRPSELVKEYGVDAVRYYFLKHGPVVEDADMSKAGFKETYNADLANGLGNLVSRLYKLVQKSGQSFVIPANKITEEVFSPMKELRTDYVLQNIWTKLSGIDKHINENKPWELQDESLNKVLEYEVTELLACVSNLQPFIPGTASKIIELFTDKNAKVNLPLFPRI